VSPPAPLSGRPLLPHRPPTRGRKVLRRGLGLGPETTRGPTRPTFPTFSHRLFSFLPLTLYSRSPCESTRYHEVRRSSHTPHATFDRAAAALANGFSFPRPNAQPVYAPFYSNGANSSPNGGSPPVDDVFTALSLGRPGPTKGLPCATTFVPLVSGVLFNYYSLMTSRREAPGLVSV